MPPGQPALAAALADEASLPDNGAEEGVAAALALAHAEYVKASAGGGAAAAKAAAVLMVVQPNERNVVDQRGIEHVSIRTRVHVHTRSFTRKARSARRGSSLSRSTWRTRSCSSCERE